MGASSQEFTEFVFEQLGSLPGLSTGPFFGGTAVKAESTQFAMVMDGALYFVVDDESRQQYERMGSRCFSYDTKNGRVDVRRYFEVPAELLEDQAQLLRLARMAIETAQKTNGHPRRRKPVQA